MKTNTLLLLFPLAAAIGFAQTNTKHIVRSATQFNGYTNYWHDDYKNAYRYGSLFKLAQLDVEKTIAQSKVNVAEDLHLSGLDMEEGFMDYLLQHDFEIASHLSVADIRQRSAHNNLLVMLTPADEAAKHYIHNTIWREPLKSHQLGAADFTDTKAFLAHVGDHKVAFVVSNDVDAAKRTVQLVEQTVTIMHDYRLHKGWFGAETLLKSVTCVQGHPLEIIGKGLNEGNTFLTFSGYMDFLMKDELDEWINKTDVPIVTDVGFSPIFGCRNYDSLQVQDMPNKKSWIDYAHRKGGYAFRPVFDPEADSARYKYDGYIATEGNKEQIDNENIPFISTTGSMETGLINSMLLFVEKQKVFTRETMWEAVLKRQEVAVLDQAKMMGPENFRTAASLLYLDRVYLENYFGDQVSIEAVVEGYTLNVAVANFSDHSVTGKLTVHVPDELRAHGTLPRLIQLTANQAKTYAIGLQPAAGAMGKTNPVTVHFHWDAHQKSTIAILDLPPAISVHRLLFGHSPSVEYPVTIHNFSHKESFPVNVEVYDNQHLAKPCYATTATCTTPTGTFKKLVFTLPLERGHYQVKTSSLGVEYTSQLGVERAEGRATITSVDLNNDGVDEYVLENDQVRITLLAIGARVIEYFVKSRNDNVLFKLWPEKADDDRRPFRKRAYYPYGGFEDFLGQGSMETHKVYKASITRKEGDYVQVKMVADYFGNEIEKTFTLYGNTPLLEIRFALTFNNPEANVLGPQPILELGKKHGPEDVFFAPTITGLEQYRMRMNDYYGRVIHLKEGWNAGYDTEEDIAFVGAYPVDQPLFLHMWMNHPRNADAHYYYAEFQPWTPIIQKSTIYFSYYIWGAGGPWENAVQALRERNLITIRK
jgi:hypothetical protein